MRKIALFLFLLSTVLTSTACSSRVFSKTEFLLDTVVTIDIYDSADGSVLDGAFKLCRFYENMFSRTLPGSEVSRINRHEDFELSDDMLEILTIALEYSRLTAGAFDITVGAVTPLWNFHSENPVLPVSSAVTAAIEAVGYEKMAISGNRVIFTDENTQIDLGGIAKGFIGDKITEYLLENGVTAAVVDLGGNICTVGAKKNGQPWNIGIQRPFSDRTELAEKIAVGQKSIVSSGIYERFFVKDGVVYHHLLNPETGYPVQNGLASVTVVSDRSVDGDALTTACFVLGPEEGMRLINSLPGIEALFIFENGETAFTDDMRDIIQ